MKIITGRTGSEHINSCDDGERNAAIVGNGDYVLDAGRKFEAEIINNNSISIADGELLMQGRHGRIVANSADTVTIENGAQGVTRVDLIVCEYSRTGTTESMSLKVLKGTPGTTSAPNPTEGNLRNGDNLHQMALYKVYLNGLIVESVESVFTTMPSMVNLDSKIKGLIAAAILEDNKKKYPIGKIVMSVENTNPENYLGFGTWVRWGAGRVPVGVNESEAEFLTVEKTGGEKTHVLSATEMPAHNHGLNNHVHSLANHTHSVPDHTHTLPASIPQDGNSGSSFFTSSEAHIILDFANAKTTNSSGACTTSGVSGNTGAASGATASNGSGNGHNNLQPYITCYMWKRTA